jgi:hypothetical protein
LEFQRSLTDNENWDLHEEVKRANPGVTTKELLAIKRDSMLKKALEARGGRIQGTKDSPLSLPSPAGSVSKEDKSMNASSSMPPIKDASLSLLNLGNLKAASPPSLRAQPKSDASPERIWPRGPMHS